MEGGAVSDELQEVEEELGHTKKGDGDPEGPHDAAHGGPGHGGGGGGVAKAAAATAILTQSFSLTFLAEWGDRSQIATIAMASAKDPYGVTVG